ncbi:sterol desaturase family protein [Dyella sp. EPa41]|uniref:sterol desaturase family protein n=1 Tax=Dyella sp. EPa41 TaxID=1561194 RepID=UPI001F265EE5|nr:sterol desaturase family protein [Dyella sp. EPa41]
MDFSAMPRALLLLPVLLLAAALEGWYLQHHRTRTYDWRAYLASFGDLAGRMVINRLLGAGLAGLVLALAYRYRLADIPMHRWWSWPLLLVLQDFFYYWMHRADHRIHWFWATHSVHHSPNQYSLAASYRLGWTGKLSGGAMFFTPLALAGFPPSAIAAALSINLLYQFWLHTELIPRLGVLEWVFNTPAHHRVHHASNAAYVDRNYGGILIVFDRLFGSFAVERPDEPCRYGLVQPLQSHNPLVIASHGWLKLWQAVRRARGWRTRWHAVFGPPA